MVKHSLITGGCGFIGSHLAETLLARGDCVTVVDDLSTGSLENVVAFSDHKHFRQVTGSVLDHSLMADLIAECDEIYHLAAAVGVRLIVDRPVETIQTNIRGTEIVLDLAVVGKKPVQIASSSEVYGKGSRVPFAEDDDCVLGPSVRPRWAYACSKLVDEFLGLAQHRRHGLPVVITRFFNTVGPRQTGAYGMVIPRLAEAALRGEDVIVHGDGQQTRTFCDVRDVVKAVIGLMTCDEAHGRVFNIGGDEEVSIEALARLVIETAESSSRIVHISHSEVFGKDFEDLQRRVPDTTRLRETIDWKPTRNLRQIVRDIVDERRLRLASQG